MSAVLRDPLHGTYEVVKPSAVVPDEYVRVGGRHDQVAGQRFVKLHAVSHGKRGTTLTFYDRRRRVVPRDCSIYRLVDGPAMREPSAAR